MTEEELSDEVAADQIGLCLKSEKPKQQIGRYIRYIYYLGKQEGLQDAVAELDQLWVDNHNTAEAFETAFGKWADKKTSPTNSL